ncbi:response regulator [Paenibacillus sp. SC116]|uniref:response regulator n=1 Tax=Paenibacillus sp. SC116 TaxID=2968986 RepID=UPI00215A1B25|nr:response regulator [Paenibacillus sp. SC116]MCR8842283.1 response regulator [Paenibacillus sp. SC116]
MKVVLVDDEKLALHSLNRLLKDYDDIDIVAMIQDPREALVLAERKAIDVVFLDIEMPEINGMVLAEKLMELRPNLRIVFVTAYNEYAIQAFEVNALDYLLKPVQRSRIAITMQRLNQQLQTVNVDNKTSTYSLCCMQSLYLRDDQNQVHSFHWRTLKAQELFAYLLLHRSQTVHKDSILEALWLDCKLDKASSLLHTTMYQVRRTLKRLNIDIQIKYSDNGYRLEMGMISLDMDQWEQELLESLPVRSETLDRHHKLFAQYSGDYLVSYDYIWAESERERLRALWLVLTTQLAQYHTQQGQLFEAFHLYVKALERYPFNEEIAWEAMKLQAELGNTYEVKKLFDKLCHSLSDELGIEPNANIQQWYDQFITRT